MSFLEAQEVEDKIYQQRKEKRAEVFSFIDEITKFINDYKEQGISVKEKDLKYLFDVYLKRDTFSWAKESQLELEQIKEITEKHNLYNEQIIFSNEILIEVKHSNLPRFFYSGTLKELQSYVREKQEEYISRFKSIPARPDLNYRINNFNFNKNSQEESLEIAEEIKKELDSLAVVYFSHHFTVVDSIVSLKNKIESQEKYINEVENLFNEFSNIKTKEEHEKIKTKMNLSFMVRGY